MEGRFGQRETQKQHSTVVRWGQPGASRAGRGPTVASVNNQVKVGSDSSGSGGQG